MTVNVRVGKGIAVHLGLWNSEGLALTRRACRRKNFSVGHRLLATTDPVTCKDCVRLRAEEPAWLIKAAYANDPASQELAAGRAAVFPADVALRWCAQCGEQYPALSGRSAEAVSGKVCPSCFERIRRSTR